MPRSKSTKTKINNKTSLSKEIGKVLGSYLTTQFVLMIIVGFASWGILSLLKVDYAVLLAILTGAFSGVPGFGMTFTTIIIAVVAILDKSNMWTGSPGWLEAIIILAVFFVFNKIIDLIIAPIFLGKTTKINPLLVILLVTFGTILLGISGAILAVPLYLVIRTIVGHYNK
mgnify:CR=1 FL=1